MSSRTANEQHRHSVRTEAPAMGIAGGAAPRQRDDRAIVIGARADVPRALEHPAVSALHRLEVVGIVEVLDADAVDRSGERRAVEDLIASRHAGTLLIAGPVGGNLVQSLADVALVRRCRLLAVPPTGRVAGQRAEMMWAVDSPLIRLGRTPHHPWRLAAKRAFDVAVAATCLVLTAPLIALLGLLIILDSRGPVVFRQRRIGRNGRAFDVLKLRTMQADAEEVLRRDPALLDLYLDRFRIPEHLDPRITRVGHFLRLTSLDELPQLVNVLRGEMSLVGPRPVTAEELSRYDEANRSLLLTVRPGLTGAWAVNGRHHVGYPERASLELDYVRAWSLRRDVSIMLRTLGAVADPGEE